MNWNTVINFTIEGVKGDLILIYSPLNQKFSQEGNILKAKGSLKGQRYLVETTDGGTDVLTLKYGFKTGRTAEFKGRITNIEQSLSATETAICFIPIIIFALCCMMFFAMGGVIGGALLGVAIALSFSITASLIRGKGENTTSQIGIAVAIGVLVYVIYAVLAFVFSLIFGAGIAGAMGLFS